MTIDPARGITSPAGPEDERGMWDRVRPPGHTRICWASALGRAMHEAPFLQPEWVPDLAVELRGGEPGKSTGATGGVVTFISIGHCLLAKETHTVRA